METWDLENIRHDTFQDGGPARDTRCIADLVLIDFDDAICQACRSTMDIYCVGQLLARIGLIIPYVEAAGPEHIYQGYSNSWVAVPQDADVPGPWRVAITRREAVNGKNHRGRVTLPKLC